MNRLLTGLLAVALFAAAVLLVAGPGRRALDHVVDRTLDLFVDGGGEAGVVYWCPMDPQIRQDGPGTCPICSMALGPLVGSEAAREPGVLQLTDRQVQQAGVRIAETAVRDLVREIDAAGRVAVQRDRETTVACWPPGQSEVAKVHVSFTGEAVVAGQVLAELTNETMRVMIDELGKSVETYGRYQKEGPEHAATNAHAAMMALHERIVGMGMGPERAWRLASAPKHRFDVEPQLYVTAPINGTLVAPAHAKEGDYISKGDLLFELADLAEVWLFVDVYEQDLPFVKAGQRVVVSTRAVPGEDLSATIDLVEPFVGDRTRTVRVRCVMQNPDGRLRPGTYARARILAEAPGVLSVPESAVLQSGRRDVVIVDEGDGRFRPRVVKVGRRYLYADGAGERGNGFAATDARFHEVLDGLEPGDRVVVAGNFLLNAEAQFQGVLEKMLEVEAERESAPKLAPEIARGWDEILAGYLALARTLVEDDAGGIFDATLSINEAARRLDRLPEDALGAEARASVARVVEASDWLRMKPWNGDSKLDGARKRFGRISKEVVAYLRTHGRARVAAGELHLFECPMAGKFDFKLWVQDEAAMANPYMGQMMLECGFPAEL